MDAPKGWEEFPPPFNFYKLIVAEDHMHFGYWPEGKEDLEINAAQAEMFSLVTSHLPPPPARLLDVGCGFGKSASLLAQRGYEVTAISPAADMIAYAQATYANERLRFLVADFMNHEPSLLPRGEFDALLFQESMQYLHPLEKALQQAADLLKPGGTLIVSDEVVYDEQIRAQTMVHPAQAFAPAFLQAGFDILSHQVIGERTAPTCQYVVETFSGERERILAASSAPETAANDLDHFLNGWQEQREWNQSGLMGYELFVARKRSGTGGLLKRFCSLIGHRRGQQ